MRPAGPDSGTACLWTGHPTQPLHPVRRGSKQPGPHAPTHRAVLLLQRLQGPPHKGGVGRRRLRGGLEADGASGS